MPDRKESLIVFHADLDNTLIYSWKYEIGAKKTNVELYEGREVSFMTDRSSSLLKKIWQKAMVVPTTTRTEEQYGRIRLKAGMPAYALVCNGGVLLKDGEEIPKWYEESKRLIAGSQDELLRAQAWMQEDQDRIFEVRNIRNLFLFTKSNRPLRTAEKLQGCLDASLAKVFCNGNKVYVIPESLDKGTAVRRFRDYIKADVVISAGDSEFDIPMLEAADLAYAPEALFQKHLFGKHVKKIGQGVFSDEMLHMVLSEL